MSLGTGMPRLRAVFRLIVSSILSAAIIYLVFVQPAAAAHALVERQPDVLLEALARLVFTALLNLVRGS